jgi:plastocyanin
VSLSRARKSRTFRIAPLAAALAAAAIVAGCGGGDDDEGTTAATTTGGGGGGGSRTVEMTEYEFVPNDLKAAQGDTITADNKGKLEHNLTIEEAPDAEKESKQLAATSDVQAGSSADLTVNVDPGKHSIVCTIPGHRELGMIGTIQVK